jgi:phenylalanyl-tRNA synthetase beta chain
VPPWHPTRAATIELRGQRAGEIGELHPDVCAAFDVPNGTVAFEVDLRVLLADLPERPRVADLGRFPSLFIDLAVVVDEATEAASVERAIAGAGAPEVASVALFDVYRGEQVPSGSKSLAYALELRSQERTLTDDDAAVVRDRVLDALSREVGAELRR